MNSSPQSQAVSKQQAAKELLRRRGARSSIHDFIQYMNPEYITSTFSRTVCASLDQFLLDMVNGLRPVLILGAPPQHGKSDIVSRYLPAYFFGKYPDLRVAGLSYAKDLASDMNRDVQRIMMSPEYKTLFPESALNSKRVVTIDVEAKRNSETFEVVGHKGTYISQGVGGPLTGKKVDLGIIDDPIKNAKEALSSTTKKSIWNWYVSTFKTRLSKNSGEIIMATRWATDDLSGRVVEITPRAKVLAFPAINERGEALVPELHPKEKLLETKVILGDYFWSAMYQQSPKQAGGSIFKDEWIKYYLPKDLPTSFDTVIHSWDMTFKDSEGTDYVVGQVWGRKGANSYLLHQVRARMSFTATLKAVKKMADEFPKALRKLVEDKANGPAVIDSLKSIVAGLVPVEPDGSKVARAHAITAVWESGNVFLPHKDIAPWIVETVAEITTFPVGANDDVVDAMTQGLRDLYQRKTLSPLDIM
ncbi:phage terminase large subunit [Yersinia enterocolitica]|nr:phage terminase large subunit [Yersinia enterocolitica]EKN4062499.1 phage terminase large subunit [Yersinia enterocolitica]